ncbi:MAG: BPTI/Kunitz-type proteinase inhibitor domain-containing protein, partial [Fidelibacterota bacterium]
VLMVNIIISNTLPEDCLLIPDIGPCDGVCPRYFYNPDTEQCEMFIWGCCDGVVPFETLEECEGLCE